ncbi:minor capsid protein [Capybara microvirus Cap1_SP_168]|nr:minor capsid protein [Capybara microvirus Cap1_SP_168]
MKFSSRYEHPVTPITNPGTEFRNDYQAHYDEDGVLVTVKVGETNIYQMIQSYADSVDIHILLEQFGSGYAEALNRFEGFYADISELPDNYVGMLNTIETTRSYFDKLPADIRSKFNNDFSQFLVASQQPDFLSNFAPAVPISNMYVPGENVPGENVPGENVPGEKENQ